MEESFERRLEISLAGRWPRDRFSVRRVQKVTTGASRDTFVVELDWATPPAAASPRDVVIQVEPAVSLLPSDRHAELTMYETFCGVPGVPVPEVLLVEDDPGVLGRPFFVMGKVEGRPDAETLRSRDYDDVRPAIAEQMMAILGRIAAVDYRELGLGATFGDPAPGDIWALELERWEKVLREHDLGPLPVTEAAIRRLRREPPPPARVGVVHGDYRIGNFLYSRNGIEGVLDWEMAHLGDPHEDLAWAFARNWRVPGAPHLVAGLLDREAAVRCWEGSSGLRVDEAALQWWQLFAHVKANAIWVTGAGTDKLRGAFGYWMVGDRQEKWMLEDMGVVS